MGKSTPLVRAKGRLIGAGCSGVEADWTMDFMGFRSCWGRSLAQRSATPKVSVRGGGIVGRGPGGAIGRGGGGGYARRRGSANAETTTGGGGGGGYSTS